VDVGLSTISVFGTLIAILVFYGTFEIFDAVKETSS